MESLRAIRWETANLERELSLQKTPELGFPTTSLSFQGDMKARICISLSEATDRQRRQTQAERARSSSDSLPRMVRRVSWHKRAEKLEFIGEIVMVVTEGDAWLSGSRRSESGASRDCGGGGGGASSSSSPQQPITTSFLGMMCVILCLKLRIKMDIIWASWPNKVFYLGEIYKKIKIKSGPIFHNVKKYHIFWFQLKLLEIVFSKLWCNLTDYQ